MSGLNFVDLLEINKDAFKQTIVAAGENLSDGEIVLVFAQAFEEYIRECYEGERYGD